MDAIPEIDTTVFIIVDSLEGEGSGFVGPSGLVETDPVAAGFFTTLAEAREASVNDDDRIYAVDLTAHFVLVTP